MLGYRAIVLLLLFSALAYSAGNDTTEGGNITRASTNGTEPSHLWGAIIGNLNGTTITDYSLFISVQDVTNTSIFTNSPNGSYADLINATLIVTRLPDKPNESYLSTPTLADFQPGGIFENFTAFAGLDYNSTPENPSDTFYPFPLAMCHLSTVSLPCPYITTNPVKCMALLKFDNGTHVEPVFVELILAEPGYNGSSFQFQFLVPKNETYYFYVYMNQPPNVTIFTPLPQVYTTGNLVLTYNITDDNGISSCWYVLDGVRHNMSSCTPPVPFTAAPGTHTLVLYANDTAGLVSSDSVTFTVRAPVVPPPPQPPQGGGGTQTPYYNETRPPQPPPQPPGVSFTITPDIYVTIDYPREGVSEFYLTSNQPITSLECTITGDFAQYARVELDSSSLAPDTPLKARISVSMTPQEILDYSGDMTGIMHCTGMYNQTAVSTTDAIVHLTINKPELTMENMTFEIIAGEQMNATVNISNTGAGNATVFNLSVQVLDYPLLVKILSVPDRLAPGEQGPVEILISAPDGMPPGRYIATLVFYDNGRPIGMGTIIINVKQKAGPIIGPEPVCVWPDLTWTVAILLIGLALSILTFYIVYKRESKREKDENRRTARKN